MIFATNKRRQDEFYDKIHKPKAAANASKVASALEDGDTNQGLQRGVGGVPLREEELRNLLLKMLPNDMRIHVLQNMRTFLYWGALKGCVKEHARLIMVHTTRTVTTHLAETEDVYMAITDEFLEWTEGWKMAGQLLELGVAPTSEAYTAVLNKLVTKRNIWRGGEGRRFDNGNGKGNKGCGKGGNGNIIASTSKDGKPLCRLQHGGA